jgi:tetratricopeptide (TPR) repeat protein
MALCPRSAVAALVLVLLSLVGAEPAAAAPAFDTEEAARRLTQEGPQAAYRYLRARELRFAGDPVYDYWLGVVALRAGHPEAAVSALERVVLLQPRNAGAYMDLAIAYFRVGDLDAAQRWLDRLEERFEVPPRLAEVVAGYRRRIERQRNPWQLRSRVALAAGYNNNVNGGTQADSLTLFFDGEPLEVTVADASRPSGDAFWEVEAGLDLSRHGTGWQPRMAVQLQQRRYRDLSAFDDRLLSLILGAERGIGRHRLGLSVLGLTMRLGHRDYLRAGRISARYRYAWTRRLQLGAGVRRTAKRFVRNPVYDADVSRAQLGLRGRVGRLSGEVGPVVGLDRARRDRPGGDRREWRLQARGRWQAGERLGFRLRAHYSVRRDDEAYSPLLFGDRRRVVRRRLLHLGADVRLWQRLHWRVGAEWVEQSANLDLFAYNRREVRTGLTWGGTIAGPGP